MPIARKASESMLVVPMRIGQERGGTLVFYYHTRRDFSEVDLQTGQALANLASAAMTTAALYEQQRVQSDSGGIGAAPGRISRRCRGRPVAVARLRRDADHGRQTGGTGDCRLVLRRHRRTVRRSRRLAVAHVDPAKVEYARELQEKYPADPNATGGVHEVIRTGKTCAGDLDFAGAAGWSCAGSGTAADRASARAHVVHVRADCVARRRASAP